MSDIILRQTSTAWVSGVSLSNRKQRTRKSRQYNTSSSGVNFREQVGVTSLVRDGPTTTDIICIKKKKKKTFGLKCDLDMFLTDFMKTDWLTDRLSIYLSVKIASPATTLSIEARATSWSPSSTGSALSWIRRKRSHQDEYVCRGCYTRLPESL